MDHRDLERRTKDFALAIIKLVAGFPNDKACQVIAYQILRSGTSIGANYREAVRAESRSDFIHKVGIVLKEAGETLYWLELLRDGRLITEAELVHLLDECDQLIAIFTTTSKTAKRNSSKSK